MDLVGFNTAESYFLIGLLNYGKKLITNKNGQRDTTEQKYKLNKQSYSSILQQKVIRCKITLHSLHCILNTD